MTVTRTGNPTRWATWAVPLAIIVLLLAGIGVGLRAWAARQEAWATEQWQGRLAAMADDRQAAVESWVHDRLGDAQTIAAYPTTAYLAAGRTGPPYAFPSGQAAKRHIVQLLRSTQESHGYEGAWLVGSGPGAPVLAATSADPPDRPLVERVIEGGAVELDLCPRPSRPWVMAAAPVWPARAGESRPVGVVLLAVEPGTYLFRLLRREPFPTRTVESLLVRREGDEVVFLSPLRHGAAALRRPIGTKGSASAAALEGREAFGEFTDYRGMAVLASVRPLRSTGWGLVVKVDRDEALEAARSGVRRTATAALALLAALVGLGFGVWRQQAASARVALARSEARFGLMLEHAADAVLWVRPDGSIAKANRRAEELYGCPRTELESLRIYDFYPPGEAPAIEARMVAARQQSLRMFEAVQRTRDGTPIPVEVASRFVELDGEGLFLSIVRDARERKAAEGRIALLNRTLRTLSEVNQLMVRELDRERFFREACRILVDHGGFRMAWVGFRDPQTDWIVPLAWSGHEEGYLGQTWFSADGASPRGQGPAGTALREGRTVSVADTATDESFAPWRQAALERGYGAVCISPIRARGEVIGVLALYAAEPGTFVPEMTQLLEGLAGDVGFAVESADARREQEAATAALRESEARFKRLAENAPDVIYRHRLQPFPRTEYVSPAVQALIGYTPEDFYADPSLILKVIHPEDLHLVAEAARGEIPSGQAAVVRWTRRDGSVLWTEIRNVVVRDEEGRVVALEGISRDVTERVLAERTVRRLSAAVEQSPVAIVITDAEGTIEYVNPAFCHQSGYSREEAIGQNPRILKSGHHPPEFYAGMYATIGGGGEWRGEILNRKKSGELYWESATLSPIVDETGRPRHYLAVKEDITERKAAEQALLRTREQLVLSQKLEAVGRLAGGIAHDFNNLLGVIIGHGEMARSSVPEGDAVRPRVEQILAAALRAAELVRQLLAFSRRQVLQLQVVDLNAEVADMETMLRRLLGEDIDLVTRKDPALGRVRADRGQIGQVLMNLAVNARDAMPRGGVLSIETSNLEADQAFARDHVPMPPGRYVQLRVADDGVGMDESVREHLFEPFFSTKLEGQGSGLGLSTVYGIVKQSGGFVWADSAPGRGTTFSIHLPRVEGALEDTPETAPERRPGGTETVLVVEDQDALRDLVCEMLREAGYEVLSAADGRAALAASDSHEGPIHLLVTDVVMPGMGGHELLGRLRERRPETRALLVSGYSSDVVDRCGVLGERVSLLPKPFGRDDLLGRVREILSSPEPS